jgi:hypothetical protein
MLLLLHIEQLKVLKQLLILLRHPFSFLVEVVAVVGNHYQLVVDIVVVVPDIVDIGLVG